MIGAFEPLFSFLSSGDKMSGKSIKAPNDMLSAVDVDKVIREDIPDGKESHWYLSMSKSQRDEAAESLSRISQAICGRTKEDIIDHIDQKCVSVKYLEEQEQNLYMPTLKDAMKKVGEDISKDVASALSEHMDDVSEILRRMSEDVGEVKRRRKEDKEHIDNIDAEQKLMKHQLSSMAGEIRMLGSVPAQINSVHDTVNRVFDAVNHKKPASSKPNSMSNLSNKQLILIGVGVVIGMTAVLEVAFTGQSTIWAKFFGG